MYLDPNDDKERKKEGGGGTFVVLFNKLVSFKTNRSKLNNTTTNTVLQ
jgi:hypothetical protein